MTTADLVDDPGLRRSLSAVEVTQAFLERIEALQPRIRALITVTPELALADARRADGARAAGDPLPLDGMPIVIKDNVDVAGIRTSVGSRLFAERVADADAEIVRRLHVAGAVVLGKANMHELAFGATSRNEAFGHVVNPQAPDRIPGGSSGGSGAAVAADMCVAAIGTDTGGSIRLPASACGVSGLRPTFGAVPNRGIQPVSASFDTAGPLARSVTDLRQVLAAIFGFDPHDPTSRRGTTRLDGPDAVAGLRLGIPQELFDRSDPSVARCVLDVADALVELGAERVAIVIPDWEAAAEACGIVIRADAFALYRDALTTTPELLEPGTRERLALAAETLDVQPARAQQQIWRARIAAVFKEVDLLLLPTIAVELPFAEGSSTVETTAAVVPYTFLLAFAHVPALSIPCGATPGGAPVGAQLAAAPWHDGAVLHAGAAVQAVTDWHRPRPLAKTSS